MQTRYDRFYRHDHERPTQRDMCGAAVQPPENESGTVDCVATADVIEHIPPPATDGAC